MLRAQNFVTKILCWRSPVGVPEHVPPQKSLKFQSPKNAIFGLLGTKFEDKRACFFIYENVAFVLSVTQSIPTSNGQMMKTKIHTFARKQILRCVNL